MTTDVPELQNPSNMVGKSQSEIFNDNTKHLQNIDATIESLNLRSNFSSIWLKGAVKILQEAKRPLHYRTICDEILKLGLVIKSGATPQYSLYAALQRQVSKKPKPLNITFYRPFPSLPVFGLAHLKPTYVEFFTAFGGEAQYIQHLGLACPPSLTEEIVEENTPAPVSEPPKSFRNRTPPRSSSVTPKVGVPKVKHSYNTRSNVKKSARSQDGLLGPGYFFGGFEKNFFKGVDFDCFFSRRPSSATYLLS